MPCFPDCGKDIVHSSGLPVDRAKGIDTRPTGIEADGSPWSCRVCTAENSSQDPKVCRCCCRLFGHEDLGFYFVDDLVPAKSPLGTSALDGMATPLDRRNKARGSSNRRPARRGQARRGTHAR